MAQGIKRVGTFHKNHGGNIILLEEGTVAKRQENLQLDSIVFTKYPINIGEIFEVEIEETDPLLYWVGFVRIGITIECPDEIQLPRSAKYVRENENYWILFGHTVFHHGRQKKVEFNVADLKVGETIGCSVHKDGTLHYYVNGIDRGISWDDKLPTRKVMYGFVDILGCTRKVRSLFYYDGIPLPKGIEIGILQNIMLLLVSTNEISAIWKYLQPLDSHKNIYRYQQSGQQTELFTYYIGKYGACPAAITKVPTEFKEHDNGSTVAVMADMCFPNLGAIISVGIICGIKDKVKLCDVLVSSKVITYDKPIDKHEGFLPNGEAINVPCQLVKLFTQLQPIQWPTDTIKKHLNNTGMPLPNVKSGVILSGFYIGDDPTIKFDHEVIGVDNDGAQLFASNQQATANKIIVKAACDLRDGKDVTIHQSTAMLLVADLVHKCLSDPQVLEYLKAKRILCQMLKQAKDEGLTINVRHAKILFCGAAKAGKTSFARLLKSEEHQKVYKSTSTAETQQILISDKVNLVGTNWITLDSKLETQQVINRLILKFQNQKSNYNTTLETNINASINSSFPNQLSSKHIVSEVAQTDSVKIPNSDLLENTPESLSSLPTSNNKVSDDKTLLLRDSTSTTHGQKITVEEQMLTYTDGIVAPVSESLPETWDLFTLLDTGGQPEFINMLPAINSSTAITFVVLNISDGKDCLNNLVTAQYKCEGYNYDESHLKYTNMHLLKCLLSSVKVAAMKENCFHPEIVRKITEDKHPKPVVYIIGTFADVLKEKSGKKYKEEVLRVNERVTELVNDVKDQTILEFQCTFDKSVVIPVDNTVSREPQKENLKCETIKIIQTIREHSNEILKKKTQYEIPISWFILELELRNSDRVWLPLTEVKEICDRIMPSHRKMEMEQIIEVLKFYRSYGMLLYFNEVEGMKNYVITKPEWLFHNLTKIVMCKFVKNSTDLYGLHLIEEMNKGICSMELLSKLDLDVDNELESFVKLLLYLKVIAPVNTIENAYFIPTILPPCNEKNIFIEKECGWPAAFSLDGECIHPEVKPFLIQFTFGTIPRGLFGFLVVQLLQDNQDTYEVYGENDHILRRCADFICFYVKPCWYVSLHDKISHLELQVRVKGDEPSYHVKALGIVTKALKRVCDEFNWPISNCRYGFLCCEHKESSQGEHLTFLPYNSPYKDEIPKYAHCKKQQPTLLSKAHTIWLEDVHRIPKSTYKGPDHQYHHVSTIIPKEKSINDMPTFKELSLNVIYQYAAHWEDLGALLELKPYKIANIARDHHNQSVDACREMLMLWLQVDPSPTWGKLDAAIRSLITTLASNLTDSSKNS